MFWKILGIACGAAAIGGLVAGAVIEVKKHKKADRAPVEVTEATTQA